MPPHCYKVEVLYMLNPHLIWAEVRDATSQDGFNFEQIGLYGVLPLDTTIDIESNEFSTNNCEEWLPAATSLMQQLLDGGGDVWFTTTFIDRRSSIFDDNIHKFGDIIIKRPNGKSKSLSKLISTSGFACYDECLFHQYLCEGKINTKLSSAATGDVIKQIESYYMKKNVPQKKWEKSIKSQTSVFRATCALEASLTMSNLEKHNQNMKKLIENKKRDLELCKGIDERSIGRGSSRKHQEMKELTPLEKKLMVLNAKKNKVKVSQETQDHVQVFEDTKMFLEANATPYPKKISAAIDPNKSQILRKIMCKADKKAAKNEMLKIKTRERDGEKVCNNDRSSSTLPAEQPQESIEQKVVPITDSVEQLNDEHDKDKSDITKTSTCIFSQHNVFPLYFRIKPKRKNSKRETGAKSKKHELNHEHEHENEHAHETQHAQELNIEADEHSAQKEEDGVKKQLLCKCPVDRMFPIPENSDDNQASLEIEKGKKEQSGKFEAFLEKARGNVYNDKVIGIGQELISEVMAVLHLKAPVTESKFMEALKEYRTRERLKVMFDNNENEVIIGDKSESKELVKFEEMSSDLEDIPVLLNNNKELIVCREHGRTFVLPRLCEDAIQAEDSAIHNGSVFSKEKSTGERGCDSSEASRKLNGLKPAPIHYNNPSKMAVAVQHHKDSTAHNCIASKTSTGAIRKALGRRQDIRKHMKHRSSRIEALEESRSKQSSGTRIGSKDVVTKTSKDAGTKTTVKHQKKHLADRVMEELQTNIQTLNELTKAYLPKDKSQSKQQITPDPHNTIAAPHTSLRQQPDRVPPIDIDSYLKRYCTGVYPPLARKPKSDDTVTHKRQKSTSSSESPVESRLKIHKELAKSRRLATDISRNSDTTSETSSNVDGNPPRTSQWLEPWMDFDQPPIEEYVENFCNDVQTLTISNTEKPTGISKRSVPILSNCSEIPFFNRQRTHYYTHHPYMGVRANPYLNCDRYLSVFVENLVTPVMMVHSKMDARIVPTLHCRDVNFSDHIRLVLKNLKIERPMLLQSITWNSILAGHSVFIVGAACSGKTMGYLPAICRLVTDNYLTSPNDSVGPIGVIICATSQSVSDIERTAKMLLGCDERVVSSYYGHEEITVATALLNGCEILIITAPSLMRLLQVSHFGVDLRRLSILVLEDSERLSEVYPSELKYCFGKINEMLRTRINKEFKVQYIVASRIWCDFMEPLARRAPDSVVCIGSFQECVLYARANMTVSFVKKTTKLHVLNEFLMEVEPSKRAVVICDKDSEVAFLCDAIKDKKYCIFATDSKMTVENLYKLSIQWKDFKDPIMAPILICRDSNLYHMNIVNAHYLVQYSMPPLYSTFCRRFAALNESYPSIFKTENQNVKILILLEEANVEQFPKIINFVKRCRNNVPDFIDGICETVLAKKDAIKAENCAPLCYTLLSLGSCPDLYNCISRHTIHKDYDKPKEWVPRSGIIKFKLLHCHSANHFSARLIANFDIGSYIKYPPAYSNVSLKMGVHFAKEQNRILLGIPKVGDLCAVALGNSSYCRCQVIKIIDKYENGNPNNVLINLLDEEIMETARDIDLFNLPDHLKDTDTYVVHIRIANIKPRDKDVVFSDLALSQIKQTMEEKSLYMKGQVALAIGNCVFVDTLEACKDLKSLNETVVISNLKEDLLERHAERNDDHIPKLIELCRSVDLDVTPTETVVKDIVSPVRRKPTTRWSYLERDMSTVYFGSAEDPNTLFVRLTKHEDCLKILIKDIQNYVATNPSQLEEFTIGDIVLAEYPDDLMYERARIDDINESNVKCFFLDQGEWRFLSKDKFKTISDKLLTQLPFQAIECRLLGVLPLGDDWTEYATSWLQDKCLEIHPDGGLKQLFVKYFTKEPAQFTGGHKYGVVVIDTYGDEDLVINKKMIELNLAKELVDEAMYLDFNEHRNESKENSNDENTDNDDWKKVSPNSDNSNKNNVSLCHTLLSQPIRSVPLVGSDEDSDEHDKWNVYLGDEFQNVFKSITGKIPRSEGPKLLAIESNKAHELQDTSLHSKAEQSGPLEVLNSNADILEHSTTLDSDDLSNREVRDSKPEDKISSNQEQCQKLKECLNQDERQKPSPNQEEFQKISLDQEEYQNISLNQRVVQEVSLNQEECQKTSPNQDEIQISNDSVLEAKKSVETPLLIGLNREESTLRKPRLIWRQTKTTVMIKIMLIGVESYKLEIGDRALNFNAIANDTNYGFEFELYGVVDSETGSHSNKGQYILVKLTKILKRNWLTLTKGSEFRKWISYDMDSIDTSSNEDEVEGDNLVNIVKNMANNSDTDSDEDFVDDVSYKYKAHE